MIIKIKHWAVRSEDGFMVGRQPLKCRNCYVKLNTQEFLRSYLYVNQTGEAGTSGLNAVKEHP